MSSNGPSPVKRKRNNIKDVNAPKTPLNAYVLFTNERRTELCAQNPNISQPEAMKLLAEKWKVLDSEEKQKYYVDADKIKTIYKEELDKYKKSDLYKEFQEKLAANAKKSKKDETKQPEKGEASTSKTEVPVFTSEFLSLNKQREDELRQLRREVSRLEEDYNGLNNYATQLEAGIQHFEDETNQFRDQNLTLRRQLDQTKHVLAHALKDIRLPNETSAPTPENVEDFLAKLKSLSESGKALHKPLLASVKTALNSVFI